MGDNLKWYNYQGRLELRRFVMAGLFATLRRKLNKERSYKSVAKPVEIPKKTAEMPKKSLGQPISIPNETIEKYDANTMVEQSRERINETVNKDDFLLSQIDEFREKAKQLQNLLATKQTKADELQAIVANRQDKADELEQILMERQEKADGITKEVEKQIDALIEKVTAKMTEIETSMASEIQEGNKENASHVKESLEQIQEQLETLKVELSEKVHSENVMCYRNIQDLIKSMDVKLDKLDGVNKQVKDLKLFVIFSFVFSAMSFIGILFLVFRSLGLL